MDKLYFAALRDGARVPKKRAEDAGYDVYACFDEPYLIISPHETRIIPSGIMSAFPAAYAAILKERGSTGTLGIGQRAGVIDSGYRGEWLISVTNHNNHPLAIVKNGYENDQALTGAVIYPYEKAFCQAVFIPLAELAAIEADPEELLAMPSQRGEGRLGSSGN